MLAALLAIATAASPAAVLALPATFEADVMSRLARLEADNAALTTEVTALRGEVVRLGASDAEGEGRRRTQRTGGAADGARTVAIYTRQLTRRAATTRFCVGRCCKHCSLTFSFPPIVYYGAR